MQEWEKKDDFLVHLETGYDVPLRDLGTREGFVRWFCHIGSKSWAGKNTLLGLLEASAWMNQ